MSETDTIFAPATPGGRSALAVIRLSGKGARAAAESLAGPLERPRHAYLRTLRAQDGEVLDHALVLWFAGPASETGEDVVELQLHGAPTVVAAVLDSLAARPGLRLANPGEFAERAFRNGKLDLVAVEGLADLIDAETAGQRRQALRQLSGADGRAFEALRTEILDALALAEAGIDFAEEDGVGATVDAELGPRVNGLLGRVEAMLADRSGERVRGGLRIAIVGPPNAGKSSLINALARRDVAIVTPVAGTTRDLVEVHLDLAGYAVTVVDTAGLRASDDPVEVEGVRRACGEMAGADLVLYMTDATTRDCPPRPGPKLWWLRNKADLVQGDKAGGEAWAGRMLELSALTGAGMSALLAALRDEVVRLSAGGEGAFVTQARHREALAASRDALQRAGRLRYEEGPDLVAEELRQAASAVGRITGRVGVEDMLDSLFGRLCIGK